MVHMAVGTKLGWVQFGFVSPLLVQLYGIGVTFEIKALAKSYRQLVSQVTTSQAASLFRGSSASQTTHGKPQCESTFPFLLVPFLLRSRWPKRGLRLKSARGGE